MDKELDDRFYDLLIRTLNYSMESLDSPKYASLRFMDLFSSLLDLQPFIGESVRDEFYEKLRQKLQDRSIMSDRDTRRKRLNELIHLFVNKWKCEFKA